DSEKSNKKTHELEEILHRIHRRVRLSLHFWLRLVRAADAERASQSADASPTGSRFQDLLPLARAWACRHGILLHDPVCPVCSGRWVRRHGGVRFFGGVAVRRPPFNLIRG